MPANGRWDLIRRLKVKYHSVFTFSIHFAFRFYSPCSHNYLIELQTSTLKITPAGNKNGARRCALWNSNVLIRVLISRLPFCKCLPSVVDCVRNVMAHAQKPDFVFRRNGRVRLNRRGRQFSRLRAAEVCA